MPRKKQIHEEMVAEDSTIADELASIIEETVEETIDEMTEEIEEVVEEVVEETVKEVTQTKNKQKKNKVVEKEAKKAPVFPKSTYFMTVEDEVNVSDDPRYPDYQIVTKEKLKREFVSNPHRIKCRIRAANHYNVAIDHLQYAYNMLSGKKIDGIIINTLIDRWGFSDGVQKNRHQVALNNNINYHAVDVADDKLKNIISYKDVLEEYKKYLKTFTSEKEHDIKRDSFNV